MYKHPGVYIEHVPSGVLSIEAASTSVAAFIGQVKRGELVTTDVEKGEPVFISNVSQFASQFGTLNDGTGGVRDEGNSADLFGHAVSAFFANGGNKAYIVPIGDGNGDKATAAIADPIPGAKIFLFTASSAGAWCNGLMVELEEEVADTDPLKTTYTVRLGLPDDSGEIDVVLESFDGVLLDPASGAFLVSRVNDGSALVSVEHADATGAGGVAVNALRSGDLSGLDLSTITATDSVELNWSGDSNASVTVNFSGASTTLAEIAAEIQTQARGSATSAIRSKFVAVHTSDARLLLIPGQSTNPATTNGVTVTASATATKLKLEGAGTGVEVLSYPAPMDPTTKIARWLFTLGTDHGAPSTQKYKDAFLRLRDYRDVSIVLLPGKNWIKGGDNSAIEAALAHSEFMKNRMVVVDPPDPKGSAKLETPKDVKDLGAPTSPYAALYYPWVNVANPHYDPDTAANKPKSFAVPPSAFAAGMWARIDGARGVWKAPAGLEATVRGALAPTINIGNDLQDNLNEWGVNCLRAIIGPTVIWGARTLATKTKPEFRYVPVRRTQNMIGESLYLALQAVVFEPNDHRLWSSLRASTAAFMDGLHRSGAFQGEKASDAFYVRCGLGATMTQADIDLGIVRLVVGFAPLKPAEFVVVQIQQIVGQTA